MDKLIKFLKSFGLNEQEVQKVLKEIPVDQSGLAGTNVAKGIFEKGGKEFSADFPLVTETMVSPFKLDKYKGLSRKETLEKADEALNFLDKELTRTSNLIINQNLQLSPEQKINFANNLRMKRQFEKEVEAFKTQPEATIIKLETKKPVNKEGIEKLIEDVGQVSPPGTMVGNIESKINILKSKAKDKGMTMDEILKETGESQVKFMAGQNEGYVRSMARQIMYNDIKSGKLKASKEIQDSVSGASNIDVIEPFRNIYGENALEQLDSLIPDIKKFANETEAEKFVRSKYEFTPKLDRPKESYTKEEMEKIISLNDPSKPYKPFGSDFTRQEKVDWLIKNVDQEAEVTIPSPEFLQNMLDSGREDLIDHFWEIHTKNIGSKPVIDIDTSNLKNPALVRAMMEERAKKPKLVSSKEKVVEDSVDDAGKVNKDDPEKFAKGGRIGYAEGTSSRGLDYLTGQEPSKGYAENAPSITLDTHEKASGNMDKYPIKVGDVDLGISGLMVGGKSYQANPYNKITGSERNVSVRGKYNVPDTGVSIVGDIGNVRMRTNQNINAPQYNYKETIKDVIRDRPYSVGIEYAPNENRNINLRYDNQGNMYLRGEAKFAKGGLSYLMGF